jgi:hypothetical protein
MVTVPLPLWKLGQWEIPIAPVPATRTCEFPRSLLQPWRAVACDPTFRPSSWQSVWPDIWTAKIKMCPAKMAKVGYLSFLCMYIFIHIYTHMISVFVFIFRYDVNVCLRICVLTYWSDMSCHLLVLCVRFIFGVPLLPRIFSLGWENWSWSYPEQHMIEGCKWSISMLKWHMG